MLALLSVALMAAVLAAIAAAPVLRLRLRRRRRAAGAPARLAFDPGRERRAEQRARQLLHSCVDEREWAMYRDLGFIEVPGRVLPDGPDETPYAYLVYPHKPIVAYEPATGRLLSEYCVTFPDLTGGGRTRLPASDDVLAKWMAITSDEARVIARANMHLVGRQHDADRVRRDVWRLGEWRRQRSGDIGARAA